MQAVETRTKADNALEMIRSRTEIIALLREALDEIQGDYVADQRTYQRYPVCVPVEVIPYNLRGQRTGEPIAAATKDVSASGMALLFTESVQDRLLVVSFPQSKQHADQGIILQVVRCRQVGPLWEIGGRFLTQA
jgi:PilZ domain